MLLILMLKRAGDKMLPCGTPISCSCSSERVEPTLTLKERSDRKLWINSSKSTQLFTMKLNKIMFYVSFIVLKTDSKMPVTLVSPHRYVTIFDIRLGRLLWIYWPGHARVKETTKPATVWRESVLHQWYCLRRLRHYMRAQRQGQCTIDRQEERCRNRKCWTIFY